MLFEFFFSVASYLFWSIWISCHQTPLARFSSFTTQHMAGPAGIFESIFFGQIIKRVPKKGKTRSNAGLGASGIHCFLFCHFGC